MAERLAMVAELDELGAAQELGFRSTAHWLAVECRLESRTARDYVRIGHRLQAWPHVRQALAEGRLTYSQCRALARASVEEDEHELLEIALKSTVVSLERHLMILRSAPSADPDIAERVHERRTVQWAWQKDGTVNLWGRLDPVDGAALIEAIDIGATRIHSGRDGPRPALGARRADALAEIAHSGCPKTTLMLHADLKSLADEPGGEILHLRDGPSIPADLARRLTCDAMVSVHGLNHGRTRRVVSAAQRRALEARDGRKCWMPGCDHTPDLDAHHILHWTHGGTSDLDNLVLLCPFHHRLLHEGGWHMTIRQGRVLVINPAGEIVHEQRARTRTARGRRPRGRPHRRNQSASRRAPSASTGADVGPILS